MRYELEFKSTPEERYDTDMLDRVEALIEAHPVTITGHWGGTALFAELEVDGLASDNGFGIESDDVTMVKHVAEAIEELVGHPVMITLMTED